MFIWNICFLPQFYFVVLEMTFFSSNLFFSISIWSWKIPRARVFDRTIRIHQKGSRDKYGIMNWYWTKFIKNCTLLCVLSNSSIMWRFLGGLQYFNLSCKTLSAIATMGWNDMFAQLCFHESFLRFLEFWILHKYISRANACALNKNSMHFRKDLNQSCIIK